MPVGSPFTQISAYTGTATIIYLPNECVVITLQIRANAVSSTPELVRTEKELGREVLNICKYPTWALDRVEYKNYQQKWSNNKASNNNNNNSSNNNKSKGYLLLPYMQGLCESIKNICGKYGIQTYFKGNRTLKNILVSPKDKDQIQQ